MASSTWGRRGDDDDDNEIISKYQHQMPVTIQARLALDAIEEVAKKIVIEASKKHQEFSERLFAYAHLELFTPEGTMPVLEKKIDKITQFIFKGTTPILSPGERVHYSTEEIWLEQTANHLFRSPEKSVGGLLGMATGAVKAVTRVVVPEEDYFKAIQTCFEQYAKLAKLYHLIARHLPKDKNKTIEAGARFDAEAMDNWFQRLDSSKDANTLKIKDLFEIIGPLIMRIRYLIAGSEQVLMTAYLAREKDAQEAEEIRKRREEQLERARQPMLQDPVAPQPPQLTEAQKKRQEADLAVKNEIAAIRKKISTVLHESYFAPFKDEFLALNDELSAHNAHVDFDNKVSEANGQAMRVIEGIKIQLATFQNYEASILIYNFDKISPYRGLKYLEVFRRLENDAKEKDEAAKKLLDALIGKMDLECDYYAPTDKAEYLKLKENYNKPQHFPALKYYNQINDIAQKREREKQAFLDLFNIVKQMLLAVNQCHWNLDIFDKQNRHASALARERIKEKQLPANNITMNMLKDLAGELNGLAALLNVAINTKLQAKSIDVVDVVASTDAYAEVKNLPKYIAAAENHFKINIPKPGFFAKHPFISGALLGLGALLAASAAVTVIVLTWGAAAGFIAGAGAAIYGTLQLGGTIGVGTAAVLGEMAAGSLVAGAADGQFACIKGSTKTVMATTLAAPPSGTHSTISPSPPREIEQPPRQGCFSWLRLHKPGGKNVASSAAAGAGALPPPGPGR